jgi:acetyl esterase/lipase
VTPGSAPSLMTSEDLLALPQPPADHTIAYGPGPQQVAELRLPKGAGPHPVVVVIHGGCWEAPWGFDHVRSLAAALTAEGYATWSLEYRRLGDPGGGWPGTLEDVARGADHLSEVSRAHPLDPDRVVALGHSAGGHLALWLAGRHRLAPGSPLHAERPLRLRGVVALAGITDLRAAAEARVCGDAIPRLLGGPPAERADRLRQASPVGLVPLGVPVRLVCGAQDPIVPIDQARAYEAAATVAGDTVALQVLEGAGHFELIDPARSAWPAVRDAVRSLSSR